MPKPDGTLYRWELAEFRKAKASYESAVHRHAMHKNSSSAHHYEALEKIAFARLLQLQTKYAGCIDSMKRITYPFCKPYRIAFVKLHFSLAWFKCYYPEQFYNVTLRRLGADDFLHYCNEDLKQIIAVYRNDGDDPPEEIVLLLEARGRNIPIDL